MRRLLVVIAALVICVFPAAIAFGLIALGIFWNSAFGLGVAAVTIPLVLRTMSTTVDWAFCFLEAHQ